MLAPRDAADRLRGDLAVLRAAVAAVPPAAIAWHPAPGEWCVNEVIGHLIEVEERGFAGRIRAILAGPQPPRFTGWEPAEVARARGDCARQTAALLDELGRLRDASAALVSTLREADYGRGGQHPTVGHLTVGDLLHEWVHHDQNHLKQILSNVQAFVWPHMGNARRFSQPDS
jgi:hypothetical protein